MTEVSAGLAARLDLEIERRAALSASASRASAVG